MGQNPLKNIPLKTFRDFLTYMGLKLIRTEGGHEVWSRKDMRRPVTIQSHVDPVPEFIVKNCLRDMAATKEDYIEFLKL
ncbi:MAG: type II toxin-antitoxin system HicA family toxin [Bacteroidales bacterium]|nr:type II toxin-antitoxin system HicA family toxin [Bacteroidales bacterium]